MSLLKVEGLVKSFGAIRAVDSVGFQVAPSEIYGLLGPNGAGKTTTISMICGLLKPDAGGIFVAGSPFFGGTTMAAERRNGVIAVLLAFGATANFLAARFFKN